MTLQTEGAGRTLTISFKCRRCGKIIVLPFKDVMMDDHYGYLHNSKLPKGWKDLSSLGHLLCDECWEAYNNFIGAGKLKEE